MCKTTRVLNRADKTETITGLASFSEETENTHGLLNGSMVVDLLLKKCDPHKLV